MDEIVQFDFPTDSPKIIKVIGVGGGGDDWLDKSLLPQFVQLLKHTHSDVISNDFNLVDDYGINEEKAEGI